MEANRILAIARAREAAERPRASPSTRACGKLLDVDVRIVLTWDTDNTDMDLWVTEPTGEKCYYGYNRTADRAAACRTTSRAATARRSTWCTAALAGAYGIQANFYGSRSASLTGPTTLQATVFTNFGRPNEKREALTLRLKDNREVVDVGEVSLGSARASR